MNTLVGQTINNRYKLESLLGDGGMGSVYRAHDINLDRMVALKLMHAHYARRSTFRARLIQEAQTAAQLDHPSIVRIYDFGDSDEGLFITMEYVGGGSLRQHLRRLQQMGKYLPYAQSIQIAIQIADALGYAHERGIIHRDVKPGNIILKRLTRPDNPDEQPFRAALADFGLVKLEEGERITESGTTLGTPAYMSPEQCAGEGVNGRSDLYSLGVVLYELLTNRLPFPVKTLPAAIAKHNSGAIPSTPTSIRPDLPSKIDAVLSKILAKNVDERYANAAEMIAALRATMIDLGSDPTQIIPRGEADIMAQVSEPPAGYELQIDTPGHPPSKVALTRAVVTLGRSSENDIVLPADGISRQHTRIRATALGWEVIDLGSANGTWLNGRRLAADSPTPIFPGSHLTVGPYELQLIAPENEGDEEDTSALLPLATVAAITGSDSQPPSDSLPPLGLFLPQDTLAVEPGKTAEMVVEIVNRSDIDDRVSLQVKGVPPSWILTPSTFITVEASGSVQISVQIRPPRSQQTPSGRQRLRLELVSQQFPDARVGIAATLMLTAFTAFEASLTPSAIEVPAVTVVTIRNTGNRAADFSVIVREPENALDYDGERGRVHVEAGGRATVALSFESKKQTFFGDSQVYPFTVEIRSGRVDRQLLEGTAMVKAAVPMFLLYAVLFVVVFSCVLGSSMLVTSRMDFGGGNTPPIPTTMATVDMNLTQTITAGETATSAVGTATAAPGLDSDNDGLSDQQEGAIGTNPLNPDSDADGLTDGEEVLKYATDPLDDDSDNDILSDGKEVKQYLTNPLNPDTSGDGMTDGEAVARGLDPLAINQTPTPSVSITPSNTPPPVSTSTYTYTPTWTPTPSITPTPTWTATPSVTPTPSFTPPPSDTPTATIIAPTATPTAVPVPPSVCVATPPIIDGIFDITEWPYKLVDFASTSNPADSVELYLAQDADNLYMAYLVNTGMQAVNDGVHVYFDTLHNGGDPDTADRAFAVGRDGSMEIAAGLGSNSDGFTWDTSYSSTNWNAVVGDLGGGQWVVEMEIIQAAEMNALTDPYAMLIQVLFAADTASWPETGDANNAATWQGVGNPACP